MSIRLCLILILLALAHSPYAQGLKVSGTVKDNQGQPLPGAQVFIHELETGVVTDSLGRFEITGLRQGSYHLHIHFLGFEAITQTIILKDAPVVLRLRLKESPFELNDIVVEADANRSQLKEMSTHLNVVSKEFLAENRSQTLVKSLERLPGVNSANVGVGISKPVIRGMSFNRILVAENGIKQEGQQWGSDHGLELDQYAVGAVEVIRGPATIIYGSDAMAGLINVKPQAAPSLNQLEGDFTANAASNNGLWSGSLGLAANLNGLFLRLRFSETAFGDYGVPASRFSYNRFVLPIENNKLKNTAGTEKAQSITLGILRDWGKSSITYTRFHQRAGFFQGAFGIPRAYGLRDDGDPRDIDLPSADITHHKLSWNSSRQFGKHWLELDVAVQQNNRLELSRPHAHGDQEIANTNLALGLKLNTYTANLRFHQILSERTHLIHGLALQFMDNTREGYEFLLPEYQSSQQAIFSYFKTTLKPDRLFFNAGVRLDHASYRFAKHIDPQFVNAELDQPIRSPEFQRTFDFGSVATGISFQANKGLSLKLNAAISGRLPNAAELASNGIHHGTFRHEQGTSSLDAEQALQLDLVVQRESDKFHMELTPYFSLVNDFIYMRPMPFFSKLAEGGQVYQYQQVDASFYGLEWHGDWHFHKRWHIDAAADFVIANNLETTLPLPFIPAASTWTELEYELKDANKRKNTYVSLQARVFANQSRVDRNEPTTPGSAILGFYAGTDLQIRKQTLKVVFSIQNLFDRAYLNHISRYRILNLPEQGRNVTLTLSVPFKASLK